MRNEIKLLLFGHLFLLFSCHANSFKPNKAVSNADTIFDPFGYYYPQDTLRMGGYTVEQLSILTKDEKSNPGAIIIENVFFQLTEVNSDSIKRIIFDNFKISNNKLELSTVDPELGEISLNGQFTGKNGPINDEVDNNTVVLKATLKMNNDLKKEVSFVWFGGD